MVFEEQTGMADVADDGDDMVTMLADDNGTGVVFCSDVVTETLSCSGCVQC